MRSKIFFHLTIAAIFWSLIIQIFHYMESFSPLIKAISEISLTDYYYSNLEKKDANDIYIVDVGEVEEDDFRQTISSFLEEVNSKYTPKAIGIDIFFDKKNADHNYDNDLEEQISYPNVVRYCEILELDGYEFVNSSELDFQLDFNNSDGYTNSLGEPSQHPCVRYFLPQKIIGETKYSDFSLLLAKKSNPDKFKQFIENNNTTNKKLINYNVSFKNNIIDIADTTRYAELENKIILIGICTQNQNNLPKFTEDTWYTPMNRFVIGRSQKDSYGIEIRATILSNIINGDFKSSNITISKTINFFISFLSYIILLLLYLKLKESFVFVKVFSQSFAILALAVLNVLILSRSNLYIDFSSSMVVLFFGPEIVEFLEEIIHKFHLQSKFHDLKNKGVNLVLSKLSEK